MEFRFEAPTHTYIDLATGEEIRHITGMLEATGWSDSTWYTEDSSERGRAIHQLTADYDLGGLDYPSFQHGYKPYLDTYVAATKILKPRFLSVEVPLVHPQYRFGGRPDRLAVIFRVKSILEIKSGQAEKGHQIQTALQAILAADELNLPVELVKRYCLYLKVKRNRRGILEGKHDLREHKDPYDLIQAMRVIRETC